MNRFKLIGLSALVLFAFCLGSCNQADNALEKTDFSKLSKESQELLEKSNQSICTCLKDHGDAMKTALADMKPVVEKLKSGKIDEDEAESLLMKYGDSASGFANCTVDGYQPTENELIQLYSEINKLYPSDEQGADKMTEINSALVKKLCPKQKAIYDDMEALSKAMRE